jgi:preprotein translocase SecE subunit
MAFVLISNPSIITFNGKNISKLMSPRTKIQIKSNKNFPLYCKNEFSDDNIQMKEMNKKIEEKNLTFINEITNEMKMIEWPSLDRLFKQFVIVVISLVFSAVFIYSVDGVFASLSKFLFEGN